MSEPLPTFAYHPDPVASGAIERSDKACGCCGRARGWIATSQPYGEDLDELDCCPWCIADGGVHARFGAYFTPIENVGGGPWDEVPRRAAEEIARRTPTFAAWQEPRWWAHCGDGAAYVGSGTIAKSRAIVPDLLARLREQADDEGVDLEELAKTRGDDEGFVVHLFRCRGCRQHGAYFEFA